MNIHIDIDPDVNTSLQLLADLAAVMRRHGVVPRRLEIHVPEVLTTTGETIPESRRGAS